MLFEVTLCTKVLPVRGILVLHARYVYSLGFFTNATSVSNSSHTEITVTLSRSTLT